LNLVTNNSAYSTRINGLKALRNHCNEEEKTNVYSAIPHDRAGADLIK